ncbi:lytic transglycosylase domain-containing protein [Aestuariivita sp.]|uniref:lytic transglycosylase domain-containing protein n=1 Tax=Aestuariivita sp. TaxID=1872407 RepID=UPI00216C34C8|nr:lytic transglycosylase domain-containing protein [Aestuariivita sp.]MCE8005875.1 lytic transglycosylase domain-containing protein [Aestuariivita sp.]
MFRTVFIAGLCLAVAVFAAEPGAAEVTTGGFEAKRVKPPAPGTTQRITVQIPLRANPAVPPPPPGTDPAPEVGVAPEVSPTAPNTLLGRYAWFWDRISPTIESSGPGRLDAAMQTLMGATDPVGAPRLQHLQDIARAHGVDILTSTIGTQVSPALVLAVISVESGGQRDAVSSAGAAGLMQLMPDTASRFGVDDRTSAPENIAGGVRYLDWLMEEFARDPILVLAGYNAGEGAVRSHAGVPPFAETRDYVPKVLAAFQVAKGLCLTPPELISDGCVFTGMN